MADVGRVGPGGVPDNIGKKDKIAATEKFKEEMKKVQKVREVDPEEQKKRKRREETTEEETPEGAATTTPSPSGTAKVTGVSPEKMLTPSTGISPLASAQPTPTVTPAASPASLSSPEAPAEPQAPSVSSTSSESQPQTTAQQQAAPQATPSPAQAPPTPTQTTAQQTPAPPAPPAPQAPPETQPPMQPAASSEAAMSEDTGDDSEYWDEDSFMESFQTPVTSQTTQQPQQPTTEEPVSSQAPLASAGMPEAAPSEETAGQPEETGKPDSGKKEKKPSPLLPEKGKGKIPIEKGLAKPAGPSFAKIMESLEKKTPEEKKATKAERALSADEKAKVAKQGPTLKTDKGGFHEEKPSYPREGTLREGALPGKAAGPEEAVPSGPLPPGAPTIRKEGKETFFEEFSKMKTEGVEKPQPPKEEKVIAEKTLGGEKPPSKEEKAIAEKTLGGEKPPSKEEKVIAEKTLGGEKPPSKEEKVKTPEEIEKTQPLSKEEKVTEKTLGRIEKPQPLTKEEKISKTEEAPEGVEGVPGYVPFPTKGEMAGGKEGEKEKKEEKTPSTHPVEGGTAAPLAMPAEAPPAPPEALPAYATINPQVMDIFERMAGVIIVMNSTGLTQTTVTLNNPKFASSVFFGTQIIIQEFSTAPKAYNIQLNANPQAVALFQENMDDLMANFQTGNYNFKVNRIETGILSERFLFKRKEGLSKKKKIQDKDQNDRYCTVYATRDFPLHVRGN